MSAYIHGIKITQNGTDVYTYGSVINFTKAFSMITYKPNTIYIDLEKPSSIENTWDIYFGLSSSMSGEKIIGLEFLNSCFGFIGRTGTKKQTLPQPPSSYIICGDNSGYNITTPNNSLVGFYVEDTSDGLYPMGGYFETENGNKLYSWGKTTEGYKVRVPVGKCVYTLPDSNNTIGNGYLTFVMGNDTKVNDISFVSDARNRATNINVDIANSYNILGNTLENTNRMYKLCTTNLNSSQCLAFCAEDGINCDDIAKTYCNNNKTSPVCGCYNETEDTYKNTYSQFLNRVKSGVDVGIQKCYTQKCSNSNLYPSKGKRTCLALKNCDNLYNADGTPNTKSDCIPIQDDKQTYLQRYIQYDANTCGNCFKNSSGNCVKPCSGGNLLSEGAVEVPCAEGACMSESTTNLTWLWIVLGIIGIAVISFCVYYFGFRNRGKNQQIDGGPQRLIEEQEEKTGVAKTSEYEPTTKKFVTTCDSIVKKFISFNQDVHNIKDAASLQNAQNVLKNAEKIKEKCDDDKNINEYISKLSQNISNYKNSVCSAFEENMKKCEENYDEIIANKNTEIEEKDYTMYENQIEKCEGIRKQFAMSDCKDAPRKSNTLKLKKFGEVDDAMREMKKKISIPVRSEEIELEEKGGYSLLSEKSPSSIKLTPLIIPETIPKTIPKTPPTTPPPVAPLLEKQSSTATATGASGNFS